RTEIAELPFAGLDKLRENAGKYLSLDLSDASEQYDWPQLVRFFKLKNLEGFAPRNSGSAKSEIQRLKDWLTAKKLTSLSGDIEKFFDESLVPRSQSLSEDIRAKFERFYETVSPYGFKFEDYPNLTRRIGIAILSSELQAPDLFREVEKLNDLVLDKLAKTNEEKKLIEQYKEYCLLKRLFSLELSREEYQKTNTARRAPSAVQNTYAVALEFYVTAQKREQVIFENMLNRMKEIKDLNAVLVTGGFHSEGLSEFFRKNRISYVRISPRITKPEQPISYLDLMTLGKKAPRPISRPRGEGRGGGSGATARQPSLIQGFTDLQKLGAHFTDRYNEGLQESIEKISSRMQVPVNELIAPRFSAEMVPSLAQNASSETPGVNAAQNKKRSEVRSDKARFLHILRREFGDLLKRGEKLRILDVGSGNKPLFSFQMRGLLAEEGIPAEFYANDNWMVSESDIHEAEKNGVTLLPFSVNELKENLQRMGKPDTFHLLVVNAPDSFGLEKYHGIFKDLLAENGFLVWRRNITDAGSVSTDVYLLKKYGWKVQKLPDLNRHPLHSDLPTGFFNALLPPVLAKPQGRFFMEDYTVLGEARSEARKIAWRTPLYQDPEEIRHLYLRMRKGNPRVNDYRLYASLALLTQAQQKDFLEFVKRSAPQKEDGPQEAASVGAQIDQAAFHYLEEGMGYEPVMEFAEQVRAVNSIAAMRKGTPDDLLRIGEELKIYAHGTSNFSRLPWVMEQGLALLNIAIRKKVQLNVVSKEMGRQVDYGTLDKRLNPFISAGFFGPYFVIFKGKPQLNNDEILRSEHAFYLFTDERTAGAARKGLELAVSFGSLKPADAKWAADRVMTYGEFRRAYKAGILKDMIVSQKPVPLSIRRSEVRALDFFGKLTDIEEKGSHAGFLKIVWELLIRSLPAETSEKVRTAFHQGRILNIGVETNLWDDRIIPGNFVSFLRRHGVNAAGLSLHEGPQGVDAGNYIQEDVRDMRSVSDNAFDGAVSIGLFDEVYFMAYGLLNFFDFVKAATIEIQRVLKPGGFFIVQPPSDELTQAFASAGFANVSLGLEKYFLKEPFVFINQKSEKIDGKAAKIDQASHQFAEVFKRQTAIAKKYAESEKWNDVMPALSVIVDLYMSFSKNSDLRFLYEAFADSFGGSIGTVSIVIDEKSYDAPAKKERILKLIVNMETTFGEFVKLYEKGLLPEWEKARISSEKLDALRVRGQGANGSANRSEVRAGLTDEDRDYLENISRVWNPSAVISDPEFLRTELWEKLRAGLINPFSMTARLRSKPELWAEWTPELLVPGIDQLDLVIQILGQFLAQQPGRYKIPAELEERILDREKTDGRSFASDELYRYVQSNPQELLSVLAGHRGSIAALREHLEKARDRLQDIRSRVHSGDSLGKSKNEAIRRTALATETLAGRRSEARENNTDRKNTLVVRSEMLPGVTLREHFAQGPAFFSDKNPLDLIERFKNDNDDRIQADILSKAARDLMTALEKNPKIRPSKAEIESLFELLMKSWAEPYRNWR
ncbi:MAG: hypothetical protein WC484_06755, partial [Candidatus Omnitrophota bacterium]